MSEQTHRYSGPIMARLGLSALVLVGCLLAAIVDVRAREASGPQWWKGNLHTHSLWSDGDDYPEMIVDWYKSRGYSFLALSDHNILSEGEKWIDPSMRGGPGALEKYRKRFGDSWIDEREKDGKRMVRLKTLQEFRRLFEEPDRFLLIQSEEITDRFEKLPIHLNATNIRELIRPRGGKSVLEVMQNNVNAVLEQRKKTGQPMIPHLNHPNYGWAVTAEDIIQLQGERFFEVYNGHPRVNNSGDALHAGLDRVWDIVLTRRLAETGGEVIFGIAVDDSHHYHAQAPARSNPGRGWIMVRAERLTPEALIAAMEAGEFYASTGVRLKEVRREGNRLEIRIDAEPGVSYTTQFIGTRKDYDRRSEPVLGTDGKPLPVTRRYSEEIGMVLAEVRGASVATYALAGDEVYVRAKVVSSKPQANPNPEGGMETAWTQPLVPARP
jgi:hypothetical protein